MKDDSTPSASTLIVLTKNRRIDGVANKFRAFDTHICPTIDQAFECLSRYQSVLFVVDAEYSNELNPLLAVLKSTARVKNIHVAVWSFVNGTAVALNEIANYSGTFLS